MRSILFRVVPILIALIVIAFRFMTADKFTNPETGRVSRVSLSHEQEMALGVQAYQQVLSQSQRIPSGSEVDEVERVARRLEGVVGDAAKDFQWEVSVLRTDEQNAFCLPGGKICVYSGILPLCQDDAGLATVLGHEMAHATSRHGAQRIFEQTTLQTVMTGVQFSLGTMDYQHQQLVMGLLGAGARYGVALPFSREQESEADHIGLFYMARAGYDPHQAIAFWKRMLEANSHGQPPEFASDHPSHENRIAALEALLPEAMTMYHPQGSAAGSDR